MSLTSNQARLFLLLGGPILAFLGVKKRLLDDTSTISWDQQVHFVLHFGCLRLHVIDYISQVDQAARA